MYVCYTCTHMLISLIVCLYYFSVIYEISVESQWREMSSVCLYVKLSMQVRWKFRKEINLCVLSHDEENFYIDSFSECPFRCHPTPLDTDRNKSIIWSVYTRVGRTVCKCEIHFLSTWRPILFFLFRRIKAAFSFYLTVMALKLLILRFFITYIIELYRIIQRFTLAKKLESLNLTFFVNESKRTSDGGYDSRRHRVDGRTRRSHEKKE